jgi:methylisocitrate lyase
VHAEPSRQNHPFYSQITSRCLFQTEDINMASVTEQMRGLLKRPGLIRTFAAHDVFTARIMELAGVEMLFLGGFGVSASVFGLPDIGLTTLTEMTDAVRNMAGRLKIPIIADGDTGHGDLQNVARTVQEFERAGAAGMLLEDQVHPKRCGHFSGKQVISTEHMIQKLEIALSSRKDPAFVVIARTDAGASEGLPAAIERANRYGEAGADMCFVEAPVSHSELESIAAKVNYPLLLNMLVGGVTPIVTAEQAEAMGYKILVDPIGSLQVAGFAIRQLVESMQQSGCTTSLRNQMLEFEEIKELLGASEMLDRFENS